MASKLWYLLPVPGALVLLAGSALLINTINFRKNAGRAPGTVIANQHASHGDRAYYPPSNSKVRMDSGTASSAAPAHRLRRSKPERR